MQIRQINPEHKKDVQTFLELPFEIYQDCPQWVPPLERDARRMLERKRHAFYQSGEAAFFMTFTAEGRATGRIAALDNQRFNAHNHSNSVFFYLFEVIEDEETARTLFEAVFDWASKRGRSDILGPKGFSALDGLGMLVKGFEQRPALGIPYNPAYYPKYIEKLGFTTQRDILSGYMSDQQRIPEKIHLLSERVQQRRGLRVQTFRRRRDLLRLLPHLKDLYNGALVGTSGNAPLTDAEIRNIADQILWFADPRLIKILMKDERPVGFLLAYPDISAALQRTRGRLLPWGWITLLKELKQTEWININGAGIIEEYRGLGGTAILFSEMEKSILEGGFRHADIVQVGVENERMQRELSSLGIDFTKAHRIYQRKI